MGGQPPRSTRGAEVGSKLAMSDKKAAKLSATTVGKKIQWSESQRNLQETII